MGYINAKQPDYENWPEGEFFDRKKSVLDRIDHNHLTGGISEDDYEYLMRKSTQFWQLFAFASQSRLELETEIFARDMEIEDLKAKLKETE